MSSKKLSLEQIRKDLREFSRYEAVIYGSYVTGEYREGSDIDVAVITRVKDRKRNFEIQKELWKAKPIYDVRVFELLPLKVKASVMENYIVLFGDELEISEYFYHWRKMWEDVRHRISYHSSYREKMEAIERRKRLLEILKDGGSVFP
ncbi:MULTISPECIES: nucleotidyltransferase domain-containing protein [Archaeoglobus]|jgi:hypothetical protein|uniref:Polymerase nucleotidyl transferase domain-containing protein n=2 Tax=Archaeoglobus fulgidus TaxID=2234 RepID=O30239_ARCFU|nr:MULTISPECIES: nucleotidyltransferase domain-containing protein [Archaeoglobus]AAB91231.1 conserved hypothetical protein [Archaeoglobus fulgidus DSM 4304]AIG99399.1 Putative glycerate kinase [Archaeoglobus fulgidus DSM 8774]MDI3498384.1 uncharacterized protein [Archaeoglobus sp.]